MRVLIASDHFPPFLGGGHRWASRLATGLARRGHEVTVATMWHGGLARVEQHGEERVPVHRVRQLRTPIPSLVRDRRQRHSPPFPDPIMIHDLRRAIAAAQPQVVLAHGWITFSVGVALTRTHIPLIASAHDYGYFCATRDLLYRGRQCSGPAPLKCLACSGRFYGRAKGWTAVAGVALSRRLSARRIAALHSVSTYVDQVTSGYLPGPHYPGAHMRRFKIPPFMDLDPLGSGEDQRMQVISESLPREPFILFVGQLRRKKGIEVLFDAYGRLDHPPPLVLIGTTDGDNHRLFPKDATVLTDVPHHAVIAAWKRALFGVMPSVWPEPLGTVTIEAISCGAPVIATAPSGMIDVVGGGAGILVPSGDPAALAGAMRCLIDDPQRRASLSSAGRSRAVSFEAETVISRYEQMLAEVAQEHR
jgi:glycosyltransferase involved in cell wall biosynthesis